MYLNMFIEVCFNKYYRICVLIKIIFNVFHFIIIIFKIKSDICEIKTLLFVAALLLAVTGFGIYQLNSEKKVGHHSEIKSESLCKKAHKKYCLNGFECYYLVDEDIVGCNCTGFYGRKRCEN